MGPVHALRRSLARAKRRLATAVRERREGRRLGRAVPALARGPASAAAVRAALAPAYERYARDVSPSGMAISLETAVLLHVLCDALRPRRAVDLGSGFSSYVLRRWAAGSGAEVVSADDSSEWLERTRAFLRGEGLPDAGVTTWDDLVAARPAPFDVVLHDLGHMDVRERSLPDALALAAPAGVVVLDDVHKEPYATRARAVARAAGFEPLSLRRWTQDRYGRFAWLLLRGR